MLESLPQSLYPVYKNVLKISQTDLFRNLTSSEMIQTINNFKALRNIRFDPATLPKAIEISIQNFQTVYSTQDLNLLNALISKNYSGSLCGSISKSTLMDFYQNFFRYFFEESNLRLIIDQIYILDESELFFRLIISFYLKADNHNGQWLYNQFDSGECYIEFSFEASSQTWEIIRLDKVYWQSRYDLNWFNSELYL